MSMQLFSFGHPCEHQLRRTCIGGTSCPLNGFPDTWCCSFIKGKINFKRDKPCEGPRCRWGFTHPSQQQFEEVTQVLNDSRPIAAKIDEAEDTDALSFHTDSPHIVDTVQCALHMLRHPPSSCARRVGQLMAYGAVKAGDAKVFLQLLKTMKKPVDNYLLGAFFYLSEGSPPNPTAGPHSNHAAPAAATGKAGKKAKAELPKKDDVIQELRNVLVDIMNAALSHTGHLVDREDQHLLQATFLQALKQYPKSNKKRQDMLEAAVECFGNRQPPKDAPAGSSAPTAPAAAPAAASATTPAATSASASHTEPPAAAVSDTRTAPSTPATTAEVAKARVSPSVPAAAPATAAVAAPAAPAPAAPTSTPPHNSMTPSAAAQANRLPTLAEVAAASLHKTAGHHGSTVQAAAPTAPPVAKPSALTISQLTLWHKPIPRPLRYDPLRVDEPLPNVFLAGGLFALAPTSASVAPLGSASAQLRVPLERPSDPHVMPSAMGSAPHHSLFGADEHVFEHFDAEKMMFASLNEELGS